MPLFSRTKPVTGRTVLFAMLAFFGVVIGANVTMVKLAIDSLPGTEVDSAYRASLGFNREIAAAQRQAERNWRVAAHVARAPDGHAEIKIEARDSEGAPITGLAFAGRLARPTDKRADRTLVLQEREIGVYHGSAETVPAGQWDLVIEASRGSERVFLSRDRVVLP